MGDMNRRGKRLRIIKNNWKWIDLGEKVNL